MLPLDDPELTRFPVAYMAEPGFWQPTDEEIEGLRNYLLKGGFVIFDDFTGWHWENFTAQMARALPGIRPIQLDISHPIFHSFFDIETLDMAPMYGPPPTFWGLFEDNDPAGRMYGHRELRERHRRVLGVLRHRLVRRRRDQRGVQVRRELRDVCVDALTLRRLRMMR